MGSHCKLLRKETTCLKQFTCYVEKTLCGGKTGSRMMNQDATEITWARDNSGLDKNINSGAGEKWLDSQIF